MIAYIQLGVQIRQKIYYGKSLGLFLLICGHLLTCKCRALNPLTYLSGSKITKT